MNFSFMLFNCMRVPPYPLQLIIYEAIIYMILINIHFLQVYFKNKFSVRFCRSMLMLIFSIERHFWCCSINFDFPNLIVYTLIYAFNKQKLNSIRMLVIEKSNAVGKFSSTYNKIIII